VGNASGIGGDGIRAKLDAYSDIFWLDPGDAAIFSAP